MYIWLIFFGSALWVFFDAKNIGVKKGMVSGVGNMGPWGWFFVTLLVWIVGFPMYFYFRGKFKVAVAESFKSVSVPMSGSVQSIRPDGVAIENLEKLASLKEKGLITEAEFEAKKKQLLCL